MSRAGSEFTSHAGPVPALTASEMREVDRIMVEDMGIGLIQMMENAGRNLASAAIDLHAPRRVVVVAGSGGNGGGGLVAARHLANRGVEVSVVFAHDRLADVTRHQAEILHQMGVRATSAGEGVDSLGSGETDVVIDALIGYSLEGDPRGVHAELITRMNAVSVPVLALDTPSGLDVTTGAPATPCVTASQTMTLALPKQGLVAAEAGELYLADISVPPRVYRDAFGYVVPGVFDAGYVVPIGRPATSGSPETSG